MKIIDTLLNKLDEYFSADEDIFIEELQSQIDNKDIEIKLQSDSILRLQKTVDELDIENEKLASLFNEGWDNPYRWINYSGNFETISGLKIPPNTTITPNDRKIKSMILRRNLRKDTIEDTAKAIEAFIHSYITYVNDHKNQWHPGFLEFFQQAAFTYASKLGDCDDFAILFQTMMHICGFGKESYVDTSMVDWHNGEAMGHCYNRVLIDDEWKVFDANAGPTNKLKCTYPDKENNWFHFNYYGTFIWR